MRNEEKLAVLCEIGMRISFLKNEITEECKSNMIIDGLITEKNEYLSLTTKGNQIFQACLVQFERIN